MRRGRKPLQQLNGRDRKILKRLTSTFDTMPQLAQKYRITKQRVHQILMTAKRLGYVINRPKSMMRHQWIDRCEVCKKILHIAKKDELVTRRQIAQWLNIDDEICHWHLTQLKKAGVVSKEFATIRSDNIIKAIRLYQNSSLSVYAVGKMFGYKNFYSILNYQKRKGIKIERGKLLGRYLNFKKEHQMTTSQ